MLYDIVNIMFVAGFLTFVGLCVAKIIVHFFILKPLIEHKLRETVEEEDPDFDWDKYINWK